MNISFYSGITHGTGLGNATIAFIKTFNLLGMNVKYSINGHISSDINSIIKGRKPDGKEDIAFFMHHPPWTGYNHLKAKRRIAYFYWEADTLPELWKKNLKYVNEIWVPCNLVKNACLKAGFSGKIHVVPTPYIENNYEELNEEITLNNVSIKNLYKFYAIFQWHKRKGYDTLIKAYLNEFSASDNVILFIKTNALEFNGMKKENIIPNILDIRQKINNKKKPRLFVSTDLLDESLIFNIHKKFDTYISPFRGEGWGIPLHDALVNKKNIISTKYGGVSELITDESKIIKSNLVNVSDMSWNPLYCQNQLWMEPDVEDLSRKMRFAYDNKISSYENNIFNNTSIDYTSKLIKNILLDKTE